MFFLASVEAASKFRVKIETKESCMNKIFVIGRKISVYRQLGFSGDPVNSGVN